MSNHPSFYGEVIFAYPMKNGSIGRETIAAKIKNEDKWSYKWGSSIGNLSGIYLMEIMSIDISFDPVKVIEKIPQYV